MEIIEKTNYAPWGTPVVPVVKKNGKLRLCADYKSTINRVICDDNHPIPRTEDIFAKMSGGRYYCKLDIHQAYLHMRLDDESALLQTITTHKGNYKVKRLMFGVKVAPNEWQRFMDRILSDLKGVSCFFVDIMVQGRTYKELVSNLNLLFERLRQNDFHLNKDKCQFLLNSITYLGHIIDGNGIRPIPEKIEAITKSRRPSNLNELRTFLGLVNYYCKFIPHLATKLRPQNDLLRKNKKYTWSTDCEKAFTDLKGEITSAKTLIPYDSKLPLATDASPTGLGAVISHQTPDGERPVAFASRSLTKTKLGYSQIDKEALAIVWGLKRFFQYCYSRKITLITDLKPLTSILHPSKQLPATSALRLLHYANFMSGFDYEIQYRNTNKHSNADYLSRFPVEQPQNKTYNYDDLFQLQQIATLPVTDVEIRKETLKDEQCRKYYLALRNGSPLPSGESHSDFTLQDGWIFKGIRVMIPKGLQERILEELHTGHIGVVKMKALARTYVWCNGIDHDIESMAKNCYNCARFKNNPSKAPLHPWDFPM